MESLTRQLQEEQARYQALLNSQSISSPDTKMAAASATPPPLPAAVLSSSPPPAPVATRPTTDSSAAAAALRNTVAINQLPVHKTLGGSSSDARELWQCGVSSDFLRRFLQHPAVSAQATTREVVQQLSSQGPAAGLSSASVVAYQSSAELLKAGDFSSSDIGQADFYVIHAWDAPLRPMIERVLKHMDAARADMSPDERESRSSTRVWCVHTCSRRYLPQDAPRFILIWMV